MGEALNLLICMESQSMNGIVNSLPYVACPLKALPTKSIEVNDIKWVVADVAIQIEALRVSHFSMA